MPLNVAFNYPAPVAKPRPVRAEVVGSITVDLRTNEMTGALLEYLCPVDANGNPVPDAAPIPDAMPKPFRVYISDAQVRQIIDIIGTELEAQGIVAAGSTSTTT